MFFFSFKEVREDWKRDECLPDGQLPDPVELSSSLRSRLEARHEEELSKLSHENASLRGEIENLRVQLAAQAQDYARVVAASEASQGELARLSSALTEQETVIGDLEAKLAEFEEDRSVELDRSMKMNEALQEELAERSLIADELELKVERVSVLKPNN
jgi:septal ring factor EnvC (AmiA/AmiB activator)